MADHALAPADRPGWIPTAMQGITMSLDLINERRIKVIVNGGCTDPRGMAQTIDEMVRSMRQRHAETYFTMGEIANF